MSESTASKETQSSKSLEVFICYRRGQGKSLAKWLSRQLKAYRFPARFESQCSQPFKAPPSVFLDTENERAAENFWEEKIEPNLLKAHFLIVIVTPDSFEPGKDNAGNWQEREIKFFLEQKPGRQVILVLGRNAPEDRFPGLLNQNPNWDWVDLRQFGTISNIWPGRRGKNDDAVSKIIAGLYRIPNEHLGKFFDHENRRRIKQRRMRAFLTTGLAVLMVGLAGLVWRQRGIAENRLVIAAARQKIALASSLWLQQPNTLPIAAFMAVDGAEALPSLLAQQETDQILQVLPALEANVEIGVFQPKSAFDKSSGKLVMAGSEIKGIGDLVQIWQVGDTRPSATVYFPGMPVRKMLPAISPGGAYLAFSSDQIVEQKYGVWVFQWGPLKQPIVIENQHLTNQLLFSPDGRVLWIAAGPILKTYFLATGEVTAATFGSEIQAMALNRTGSRIALAMASEIQVLEHREYRQLHSVFTTEIKRYDDEMLLFDPMGVRLLVLTGSKPRKLNVFDVDTGRKIGESILNRLVKAAALSPDGQVLALGDADGKVSLLQYPTLAPTNIDLIHSGIVDFIQDIGFRDHSHWVATLSADDTARVWDRTTGIELGRATHRGSSIAQIYWTQNGRLLTVGNGGLLRKWQIHGYGAVPGTRGFRDSWHLAADASGQWIAAARTFYGLEDELFIAKGPAWETKWKTAGLYLTGLGIDDRDGALIGVHRGQMMRWPAWKKEGDPGPPDIIEMPFKGVGELAKNGRSLLLKNKEGTLAWVGTSKGKVIPRSDTRKRPKIVNFTFSSDSTFLAEIGTSQTEIMTWPDGKTVLRIPKESPQKIAFHPHHKFVAVGCATKAKRSTSSQVPELQLWRLSSEAQEPHVVPLPFAVTHLEFFQNGAVLAVAFDRFAGLFSVPDLAEIGRVDAGSEVIQFKIMPDGRRILIGADEVQVRWMFLEDMKREICRRLGWPNRKWMEDHFPENALLPELSYPDLVEACMKCMASSPPN